MPERSPTTFWVMIPSAMATRGVPAGANMSSPSWSRVHPSRQACQSLDQYEGPATGKGPTTRRIDSLTGIPYGLSLDRIWIRSSVLFEPPNTKGAGETCGTPVTPAGPFDGWPPPPPPPEPPPEPPPPSGGGGVGVWMGSSSQSPGMGTGLQGSIWARPVEVATACWPSSRPTIATILTNHLTATSQQTARDSPRAQGTGSPSGASNPPFTRGS